MSDRVVLVVQARMGSSRLPGKALMPLAGTQLLDHVLARAERVLTRSLVEQCVLATSVAEKDRALVSLARRRDWAVYCGSERDVLERVRGAAASLGAGVVVRVTGDCPLLAPDVVADVLTAYFDLPLQTDYLSNDTSTTGYPDGLDVEVFSMAALDAAADRATDQQDREHVTPWIRRNYAWGALRCGHDYARLKLSVDTAEDLERVRQVYACLDSFGDTSFAATIRAATKAGFL